MLAVGLGKEGDAVTPEQVRRAAGAAGRALAGTDRAFVTLSELDLQAAVEGTILGSYVFTAYRSEKGDAPVAKADFASPADGTAREHKATLKAASSIAEAVLTARDLINTPPNDLYPASFADRAKKLAEDNGLEFEVLDEKALKRKGFGGILGVGGGSARQPRLRAARLQAGQGREEGRAGRQGHHVRLGRHLAQARREHGPHDLGHVRRRRRARFGRAGREAEVPARGRRAHPAGGEPAVRDVVPARATC